MKQLIWRKLALRRKVAWVLRVAFLVSAIILSVGCGTSASQTTTLNVFEWSGFELPEFWQQFAEKHPDVRVDFSFFGEDAEAFAKMQTGYVTDLVHPCSGWWQLYVDNNLVQPLDVSRLENLDKMPEALTSLGVFNGQQYFIPWDWGYESILVRTDKVQTIPTSWADLWNPEYAGHVAIYDSGEAQHIVASLVLGFDPFNTTPEQDEAIVQKLIQLKPNLLTYWTDYTEVVQLVASGDVWVAGSAWPDSLLLLANEGIPAEYITPVEGRIGYVCGFGIPTNAKNVDLAYDYINAVTSTEAMMFLINEYGYGAANMEAPPLANQEIVRLLGLDDLSSLDETTFYESVTAARREQLVNDWARVKAAP